MFKKLWRAIEIPFDPLDENTNRDNIISALINVIIVMLILYLVPVIVERGLHTPQMALVIIMIVFLISSRLAIHKVGNKFVSITLALVTWLFINVTFLFFENGLRAPTYIASLAFLIVYVGLLHGQRSVVAITAASVLVGLAVGLLEMQGIYLTQPRTPDIRWAMIALLIVFPIIAFIVTRTLHNLRRTITLYRDESKIRQQSEIEIKQLHQELEAAYATTLEGWARALELRDKETEGHSRRVIQLTTNLARSLGLSEYEVRHICYGAILHDIGKVGVPDAILRKPGPLTPDEWVVIRQHPVLAYDMLKDIDYLKPALAIPYSHHENWDGSGYPQGLKGEEIPLSARIFAVVDNWDALTTNRPYRNAWLREQVVSHLKDNRGKLFDAQVVDVFLDKVVGYAPPTQPTRSASRWQGENFI